MDETIIVELKSGPVMGHVVSQYVDMDGEWFLISTDHGVLLLSKDEYLSSNYIRFVHKTRGVH